MNKLLTMLDKLTTASLPAVAVTAVLLIMMKLFGYISYSSLVVLSPVLIWTLVVGAVNFLSFCIDRD